MNFDSRSRQVAQSIRRAVEVMEMSSTKTPGRLTRFDQYRGAKSRNRRVAALALGIAVPALLLVAVLELGTGQEGVPLTSPSTSAAPTSVSGSSDNFGLPFTYTLPPGWTFGDDDPGWLSLDPPSAIESGTSFYVLRNMRASRPDCSSLPDQKVGGSSDAMTRWFSRHPALDATTPRSITLPGASGSFVDLTLAADWNQTCPNGLMLITNPHGESWGFEHDTDKIRFYVLDLPDGNTVTIVVDVLHASDFKNVIDQAAPVVESFDFST